MVRNRRNMCSVKFKWVLLIIVVNIWILHAEANSDCKHQPGKIPPSRSCRKSCKKDADCKSKRKTCNCDNVCGMSCFNIEAECEKEPEEIENGVLQYDSMVYNSKALYSCNEGFSLEGDEVRLCQSDRNWSGKPPKCVAGNVCSFPPRHSIGFPNTEKSVFYPGDVITYECRFGYTLSGNENITCQKDLKWSPITFLCKKVSCGDPGSPLNGYVEAKDFLFGSWAVYKCDKGYEISHHRRYRLYCSTTGRWSGERPSCRIKTCPAPIPPLNGEADAPGFEFQDRVQYKCNQGYVLRGNSEGMCDDNGEWGEMPKCEVDINCDFDKPGRETCGYTDEGDVRWTREFLSDQRSGFPGYIMKFEAQGSPLSNAILKSPIIPSRLTHCIKFYYFVKKQFGSNDDVTIRLNGERVGGIAPETVTVPTRRWVGYQISLTPEGKEIVFEIVAKGSVEFLIDDLEVVKKECVSTCDIENPCLNGGRCVDEIEDYYCSCTKNYRGRRCEEEILCSKPMYFPRGTVKAPPKIRIGTRISYECNPGYRARGTTFAICNENGKLSSDPPECIKIAVQTKSCPDHYKELVLTCYRQFAGPKNYEEAKKVCEKDGGQLANIRSERVNNFLWDNTWGSGANYWIGLHMSEFDMFWSNGDPFERGHGVNHDLTNAARNNCGKYYYRYYWAGEKTFQIRFDDCSKKARFICEKWKDGVSSYDVSTRDIQGVTGVYHPVSGLLTREEKRQIYRKENDPDIFLFYEYHPGTERRNWYIGGYSITLGRPRQQYKARTYSNVLKPDAIETPWRDFDGRLIHLTTKKHEMWDEWSEWECDVKCGSGKKTRFRQCKNGLPGSKDCKGNDWEEDVCNLPACESPKPQPGNEEDYQLEYNGILYKFEKKMTTWDEARSKCSNIGGELAVSIDPDLQKILGEKIAHIYALDGVPINYWINGISERRDTWRFQNGTVIRRYQMLWGQGEPNGDSSNRDCVELSGGKGWNDHGCDRQRRSICQTESPKRGPCYPDPCNNRGSCRIGNDGDFLCHCRLQFSGKRCEINPFAENADEKATAMPTSSQARTTTQPEKEDPCTPYTCNGGGRCKVDSKGEPVCFCNPGNLGKYCETKNACSIGRISGNVKIYMGGKLLESSDHISEGATVNMKCENDLEAVLGETAITCNGGNNWSRSTKVLCSNKLCILENLPENLDVYYENGDNVRSAPVSIASGRSLRFGCKPPKEQEGINVHCAEGEWEPSIPTRCVTGATCPKLPPLTNGKMTVEPFGASPPFEPGMSVGFSCNKTYKLEGPPSIECRRGGQWSEKPAICKEVGCLLFTIDLKAKVYVKDHEGRDNIEVESGERLILGCKNSKKKTQILCKGKLIWEPEYESVTCP